jgi:hypothetical protein
MSFEPTTLCLAIVKRGISPISVTALDSRKSVFLQVFLIFVASPERYRARSIFVRDETERFDSKAAFLRNRRRARGPAEIL